MRNIKYVLFPFLILFTTCDYHRKITAENINLSPVYSSGMILQTSPVTIISGKASPGGVVAVRIKNYLKLIRTDNNGNWLAKFPEIILKEPFSITIEGSDTTIALDSVISGEVIIVAGDGNLPVLFNQKHQDMFDKPEQDLRIFSFFVQNDRLLNYRFHKGRWSAYDEKINNPEIPRLYTTISNVIADSKSPIGIIDLTWPGSSIESWLPSMDSSKPSDLDPILRSYRSTNKQILAMRDTCRDAIKKGVTKIWFNDELWRKTNLPAVLGQKNEFSKSRIVYMRKKIYVSSKYLTSGFTVNLGHILGDAQYYFNEEEIVPQIDKSGNNQLVIPDTLMRIWSNIITIRLFCTDSLSGLYGDKFVCYNTDSSYFRSIDEEWKYSFTQENEFPAIVPIEQNRGLVYNALLLPVIDVNAGSIVFLFRNSTIYQTKLLSQNICEISGSLPETWEKTFAFHFLSLTDSLVYNINANRLDSLINSINDSCLTRIMELK